MKIKSGFVTYSTDGEQLMICVDGSFGGIIRSNSTAGKIIDFLKEDTTKDEVVDKMHALYDADKELIAEDVDGILESLRSVGALDE